MFFKTQFLEVARGNLFSILWVAQVSPSQGGRELYKHGKPGRWGHLEDWTNIKALQQCSQKTPLSGIKKPISQRSPLQKHTLFYEVSSGNISPLLQKTGRGGPEEFLLTFSGTFSNITILVGRDNCFQTLLILCLYSKNAQSIYSS